MDEGFRTVARRVFLALVASLGVFCELWERGWMKGFARWHGGFFRLWLLLSVFFVSFGRGGG